MKASKARQIAVKKAIGESGSIGIYHSVIEKIKNAVNEKECYWITVDIELPECVIRMLLDDGYQVIPDLSAKQPYTEIRW